MPMLVPFNEIKGVHFLIRNTLLRGFGLFGIWFYKYAAPTALKNSARGKNCFALDNFCGWA
jgi:hypothetical protein